MATEADEAPEKAKAKKGKKGKEKGGGGKKKIIMVVGALAVIGLGAKMTVLKAAPLPACPPGTPPTTMAVTAAVASGTGTVGTTAAPTTSTTAPTCLAPVPSGVAKLDAITLNLADGRYLKLGLGLQLDSTLDVTKFTAGDGGGQALDLAISMIGAKSYADLSTPEARDQVKQELSLAVSRAYDGHVIQVFFTEFVMQ